MLSKYCLLGVAIVIGTLACESQPILSPKEIGMVSYTYRNEFANDVPATLDEIQRLGIVDMEFSNLFGQTAQGLRKLLDERKMSCSSFGVSYGDLVNKTSEVAENANALGAKYVRVASIPHERGSFTLEEAEKAVTDFNRVGKVLRDEYGLLFIYHNHGFEFHPHEGGTLYDYIVNNTDPEYVGFELDILWAFFPGFDPVELLEKYGSRYKALHLKDLKQGVEGNLSGSTAKENDVALGTGQIDIIAILKAAKSAGVMHYYIEDESDRIDEQVPQSIHYLKNLRN
ncbi:sugar phosphate isomerase/epimerase family protein [Parapedobacter pyrenivorans]|nr:sugar phosphate isomerase/epimerase [Parapedobacter pyrenivorans]